MEEKTRELPVPLTNSEFMLRATELGQRVRDLAELEFEKKRVASRFKDRVDEMEGEVYKLTKIVNDRAEMRPVEVYEDINFTREIVEIFRADTHQVIDHRPLTEPERKSMRSGTGRYDSGWVRRQQRAEESGTLIDAQYPDVAEESAEADKEIEEVLS